MKIDLSATALDDLDGIRRWIARDDRNRAISFTRELLDEIGKLATWPNRFPTIDPDRPDVRRLNYRGYRIFYRVEADQVTVLHVHHRGRGAPDVTH